MRASFSLLWATAWAFQKREANSAEQQNINQASCKIWLRSILSHWSETTQSIIQNALVSSRRSSGSKLERFSPKNWKKKNCSEISGGGVHELRGWNKLPIKLCRAFSDHYPSLIPQGKTPTIWIPVGKKGGHPYTHRTRQTPHQESSKLTGLYQQRILKLLWNLVLSLCSVSSVRKPHCDFQRSQVSDAYYI